jgi:hypothetical protein
MGLLNKIEHPDEPLGTMLFNPKIGFMDID